MAWQSRREKWEGGNWNGVGGGGEAGRKGVREGNGAGSEGWDRNSLPC